MKEMDRQAIEAFLAEQAIGHLGTFGEQYPFVVPVAYLYRPPMIFFATKHGQKTANIAHNSRVCFEVSETIPELGIYRSVVATGRAEIVEDPDAQKRILDELTARFERLGPRWLKRQDLPAEAMSRTSEGIVNVIAVRVENISGLDYEALP